MSTAAVMWSSSPSAMGRPSSPLNPYTNHAGPSSSPMTSPTPPQQHQFPSPFTLGAPPSRQRPAPSLQIRYNRPSSRRSSSFPLQTPPHPSGGDPFGEGKGATPVESAMWKERFTRRVKDRERRKRARDDDINRRRSMDRSDEILDEEEADRRAQEDDEEIFRRLMVLQRRKAEHAAMVSYEVETGGSDPALPDFWDDELEALAQEERRLSSRLHQPASSYSTFDTEDDDDDDMMTTPTRGAAFKDARPSPMQILDEEDEWELEAAAAEEAEREAEDAEIARRVEEAYGLSLPANSGGDLDMDMDAFDAMDIE